MSQPPRLYDLAAVCRSKNAGPFLLTVDLMFDDRRDFEAVLAHPDFTATRIAGLYGVAAGDVRIAPFARIRTIKVTLPRACSAGGPGDVDVYGCQRHVPLGNLPLAGAERNCGDGSEA